MYLKSKRIAVLGLLLALAVVMIILSGVIEMSTIFFLAAASFCVGIAVREYGIRMGAGFFFASVILGFLLAPQKLYLITYSMMALYILLSELLWIWLYKKSKFKDPVQAFRFLKYIVFNIIYVPTVITAPRLVYEGDIDTWIMAAIIVGGQIALFLFEKAYCYFQSQVWGKFRKNLD